MKACFPVFIIIVLFWPKFSISGKEDISVVEAMVDDMSEKNYVWSDTTDADVRAELTITTRRRTAAGSDGRDGRADCCVDMTPEMIAIVSVGVVALLALVFLLWHLSRRIDRLLDGMKSNKLEVVKEGLRHAQKAQEKASEIQAPSDDCGEPSVDVFAAHAMQGLLSHGVIPYEKVAELSYNIAIIMRAEGKIRKGASGDEINGFG